VYENLKEAFIILTKRFEYLGRDNLSLKEKIEQQSINKTGFDRDRRNVKEEVERLKFKLKSFE
jgi:hypothetical protein